MKTVKITDQDLQEFYEGDYPRGMEMAFIPQDDDAIYAQVLQQIRPYLRPGLKVLDLGCNNGNLSLYMARAGCEVLGIDLAKSAVDIARRSADNFGIGNVRFECLDFLQEWNELELFHFVLCSHVVEHIPQDELFVQKIAHVLKPNGHCLVITPTVYSSLYWVSKVSTGRFVHDDEVGHLRRYSKQKIIAILELAGLVTKKVVFLDSLIRDWFILCKPLRVLNRIWGRRYVRTVFNQVDSFLAPFLFPATICVHAQRAATDMR